ncbi:MAG: DUF459 domain-containing protein [Actinomycetia bacterium]|nr:DUF459 domain-containing protein [Actinomycetes bacterium]MCP4959334.1 DUF459 domain-containing protein [Actinomycetes bacterium]
MPAGKALGAGLVALLVAMLLNADQLENDARRKPFGNGRDVSLAIWEPVNDFAGALGLTAPRRVVDEALGRDVSEGTEVVAASSLDTSFTTAPGSSPSTTVDVDGDTSAAISDQGSAEVPTSSTAPTTTTTETPRSATVADPLHLWVGGDSMSQVFGESLVRMAAATEVIEADLDYRISTGLTRPDYFNWTSHFADVISSGDPEVMVVIFGANDAQGMELTTGVFQPFDDEWVAEYTARVRFTMDQLSADSSRLVIWVGQPIMRSAGFDAKMLRLDEIYEAEAAGRERVVYLDTRPLFANSAGDYEAYLTALDGQVRNMRQQDGTHLSRVGGDLLADAVLDLIGQYVDVQTVRPEAVVEAS